MKGRPIVPLLAALHLVAAAAGRAQNDQQPLEQQILHGSVEAQSGAVEDALYLGPQRTGPEVRAALIALLERNNRLINEARKRNVALSTVVNPEFAAHVAHAVSQLGDPQAIPALAGALGSGSTLVPDALADFGERAAGAVLRVVADPAASDYAVDDGLLSLRFMVEGRGARPLSAGTLSEMRRVAKQRLTGRQYFTTLGKAIHLAVALEDPELRRIVESLAADPREVAARGIEDPELVERMQKAAAGRLASSVPPRPWYRTPAERARALGLPEQRNDGPDVLIEPR